MFVFFENVIKLISCYIDKLGSFSNKYGLIGNKGILTLIAQFSMSLNSLYYNFDAKKAKL